MTELIAILLQRISELEKMAMHDSLTGSLNGHALNQILIHPRQISVIAVDIKGL
ncbi:hypothetical protein CAL7716_102520 (plasmid) [Calothrix sp. PCC 7716]|nr:hypothetical protein CAL7716_102520 [Calothrix sp. PCC 7716]